MNDLDNEIHRRVIRVIHEKWCDGEPFAIMEVIRASGVSRSSVIRMLTKLQELHFVLHAPRAFSGRHYRTSVKWVDVDDVIETFELARVMNI